MNELFSIPECKSPRLQWMDRHGIWTGMTDKSRYLDADMVWKAESAGLFCLGATEDEAIANLAGQMGIRLWNEPQANEAK
jgi:hypothetical protein